MKRCRIGILVLSLALVCTCALVHLRVAGAVQPLPVFLGGETPAMTALVLGLDDAAENADVVFLVRYVPQDAHVVICQLPRDMYWENPYRMPKLNHIYAACRAAGHTPAEALRETVNILEDTLGIPIHAAVAVQIQTFSDLVDALGGVTVCLPRPLEYTDPSSRTSVVLPAGEHRLDGAAAAQFVRFRRDYVEGDLGRVDAQKIFLRALFCQVMHASPALLFDLLLHPAAGMYLSVYQGNIAQTMAHAVAHRSTCSLSCFSLPGKPICPQANGPWYYVINRAGTIELLHRYFVLPQMGTFSFDTAHRLYKENDSLYEDIYFSDALEYHVYTDEEIEDIKIKGKDR